MTNSLNQNQETRGGNPTVPTLLRVPDLRQSAQGKTGFATAMDGACVMMPSMEELVAAATAETPTAAAMGTHEADGDAFVDTKSPRYDHWFAGDFRLDMSTIGTIAGAVIACALVAQAMRPTITRDDFAGAVVPEPQETVVESAADATAGASPLRQPTGPENRGGNQFGQGLAQGTVDGTTVTGVDVGRQQFPVENDPFATSSRGGKQAAERNVGGQLTAWEENSQASSSTQHPALEPAFWSPAPQAPPVAEQRPVSSPAGVGLMDDVPRGSTGPSLPSQLFGLPGGQTSATEPRFQPNSAASGPALFAPNGQQSSSRPVAPEWPTTETTGHWPGPGPQSPSQTVPTTSVATSRAPVNQPTVYPTTATQAAPTTTGTAYPTTMAAEMDPIEAQLRRLAARSGGERVADRGDALRGGQSGQNPVTSNQGNGVVR